MRDTVTMIFSIRKNWMVIAMICSGISKAPAQGSLNVASGKVSSQNQEVYFVMGGEILNATSNGSYSIIPSSLPVNQSLITGIKDQETTELNVYPNPFLNKLYVDMPQVETVELLDSRGIVLKSSSFMKGELDVYELPAGLYLIRAFDGNNARTIKVVKYGN
jgi:hypothetical protein